MIKCCQCFMIIDTHFRSTLYDKIYDKIDEHRLNKIKFSVNYVQITIHSLNAFFFWFLFFFSFDKQEIVNISKANFYLFIYSEFELVPLEWSFDWNSIPDRTCYYYYYGIIEMFLPLCCSISRRRFIFG